MVSVLLPVDIVRVRAVPALFCALCVWSRKEPVARRMLFMGMGMCEAWLIVTFFPWFWGELRAASDIVDIVSGHDWFGHCFQKRA